jgi:excisionase family DNA binding protein
VKELTTNVSEFFGEFVATALETAIARIEANPLLAKRLVNALSASVAAAPVNEERVVTAATNDLDSALKYISTARAASLAGVTPSTIREWVKQGKLRGYRAGRLVRVSRAELEFFLRGVGIEEAVDPNECAIAILSKHRHRSRA